MRLPARLPSTRACVQIGLGAPLALAALLALHRANGDIGDLVGTKPGDVDATTFQDADVCTNCHGNGVMGDKSFLPSDTWAGTMMANAARDPVFYAALTVANQDTPNVGSYCLRCHSPVGFVRGHATPPNGSAFDATDKQGVGCETCHRMVATNPSTDPYVVSDAQVFYDNDKSKRGPFPQCTATNTPMGCADSPAHEVIAEPNLASASFCGQCHQVTNPDRKLKDANGVDTTHEFPLDTTYDEWKGSSFSSGATAQSCQDCHMQKKQGQFPISSVFGTPKRTDPRKHAFVGGNVWGIQAIMAANTDRAMKYPDAFQLAQDETIANLGRAVSIDMSGAPATGMAAQDVTLTVKVKNLTGHKFPTGYAETRRAWIAIVAVDGDGKESFLAGAYDGTTGNISNTPATHVYRAVHGKWNGTAGEPDSHLTLHDMVLEDTRIPPAGFVPTETTKVIGAIDYSDGAGGFKSEDDTSIDVTFPAGLYGKVKLAARVYYQSMTKEYVDFLESENTTDTRGHDLQTVYGQTMSAPPIQIAEASADVDFGPMPTGVGGSSSSGSASSASSSSSSSATGTGGGGSSTSGGGCDCATNENASGGLAAAMVTAVLCGTAFGRSRWGRTRRRRGDQGPDRDRDTRPR